MLLGFLVALSAAAAGSGAPEPPAECLIGAALIAELPALVPNHPAEIFYEPSGLFERCPDLVAKLPMTFKRAGPVEWARVRASRVPHQDLNVLEIITVDLPIITDQSQPFYPKASIAVHFSSPGYAAGDNILYSLQDGVWRKVGRVLLYVT